MAKGKIVFEEERCKGCELCISVCPAAILSLKEDVINSKGFHPAYVVNEEKCTGCSNCAAICPDVVITVHRIDK